MPLLELSVAEVKYLATMNGQNISVMKQIAKKSKTAFPDLPLAEGIQAKFAAVLPEGLPYPFPELRPHDSTKPGPRKAGTKRGIKRR